MTDRPKYWFPAKRYGWGWGLPVAWQGWVVMAIFLALIAAGVVWLLPQERFLFVGYTLLLIGLLVVVCWIKGEPPGWRWGGR